MRRLKGIVEKLTLGHIRASMIFLYLCATVIIVLACELLGPRRLICLCGIMCGVILFDVWARKTGKVLTALCGSVLIAIGVGGIWAAAGYPTLKFTDVVIIWAIGGIIVVAIPEVVGIIQFAEYCGNGKGFIVENAKPNKVRIVPVNSPHVSAPQSPVSQSDLIEFCRIGPREGTAFRSVWKKRGWSYERWGGVVDALAVHGIVNERQHGQQTVFLVDDRAGPRGVADEAIVILKRCGTLD